MCDGDTWRRLDADFDRIIGSLEVVGTAPGGAGELIPGAAAQPGWGNDGRANRAGGSGTVLEFVRKEGGDRSRPQFALQGGAQGGRVHRTATEVSSSPETVRFGNARRAKLGT